MKNLIVFVFISLISAYSYSGCGEQFGYTFNVGSNDVLSTVENVEFISSASGCDVGFTGTNSFSNSSVEFESFSGQSTPSLNQYLVNMLMQESFNVDDLIVYLRNESSYNYSGGLLDHNGGNYFSIKYNHWHNTGEAATSGYYYYHVNVYHAERVSISNEVFCFNKNYLLSDIFTSIPSEHTNIVISDNQGNNFNVEPYLFEPFVGTQFGVEYLASVISPSGEVVVSRYFPKEIGLLGEAFFTGTIQENGVINESDDVVVLSNYAWNSSGVFEFIGNGVVNGPLNLSYFDPGLSGGGDHLISVRTNNDGCYSNWRDTVFSVVPLVTNLTLPTFNFSGMYGNGNFQIIADRIDEDISIYPFHYECSESDVTVQLNAGVIVPGVVVEYKVVFNGLVIESGTVTDNFSISLPSTDEIVYDFNPYSSLELLFSDPSIDFSNIIVGTTEINSVNYNLASRSNGNVVTVLARKKNVVGDVSGWNKCKFGIIKTPEIDGASKICFNNDVYLNSLEVGDNYSNNVHDSIFRNILWDIDQDGDFDLNQNDLVVGLNDKINFYNGKVYDSIFNYGYVDQLDTFVVSSDSYHVCESNLTEVKIVKNPVLESFFSVVDTVVVGSYVESYVTGEWIDVLSDSIIWNWSDGSPEYFGDVNYHFLNDLGYYSLNVKAIDSFGCVSQNQYTNHWFVDGVLKDEDLSLDFKIHPNPVTDNFKISSSKNVEVISVVDLQGNTVPFRKNGMFYNIETIKPGVYFIIAEINSSLFTFKFMKL